MSEPATLFLVCGLPGAGKTTFAKRLEAERGAVRLCPDDWIELLVENPNDTLERDRLRDPSEELLLRLARDLLTKGVSVILEYGFWSEEERSLYMLEGLNAGARVELYALEGDFQSLWARVSRRNQELVSPIWVMTEKDLKAAWDVYVPVTLEELAFYDDGSILRY